MKWPDRGVELARLIIHQSGGSIIPTISRVDEDRHEFILTMRREYYDKSTMFFLSKAFQLKIIKSGMPDNATLRQGLAMWVQYHMVPKFLKLHHNLFFLNYVNWQDGCYRHVPDKQRPTACTQLCLFNGTVDINMRIYYMRLESLVSRFIKTKKLKKRKCFIMPSLKECKFNKVLPVSEYNSEGSQYKPWQSIRRECRRVHGIILDDKPEICGLVTDPGGRQLQLPLSMILKNLPRISSPSHKSADEFAQMVIAQLQGKPLFNHEMRFKLRKDTKDDEAAENNLMEAESPASVLDVKEDEGLTTEVGEKAFVEESPIRIDSDTDRCEDPIIIDDDITMKGADENEMTSTANKISTDVGNLERENKSPENSLPKKEHILGEKGILDYIMNLEQLSEINENSENESIKKSSENVESNNATDEGIPSNTDCNFENKKAVEDIEIQNESKEDEEAACDESVSMSDSMIVQRYEEVYDISNMLTENEDVPEISLSFWDEIAFGNLKEPTDLDRDKASLSRSNEAASESAKHLASQESQNSMTEITDAKEQETSKKKENEELAETKVIKESTPDRQSSKVREASSSGESCYSDEFLIVSRYEDVFESGMIPLQAESPDSEKPLVIVSSPENEDQNILEG